MCIAATATRDHTNSLGRADFSMTFGGEPECYDTQQWWGNDGPLSYAHECCGTPDASTTTVDWYVNRGAPTSLLVDITNTGSEVLYYSYRTDPVGAYGVWNALLPGASDTVAVDAYDTGTVYVHRFVEIRITCEEPV